MVRPNPMPRFGDHTVVTVEPGHARAPFDRWMEQHARQIALHSNDRATLLAAMRAGMGLGFAPASLKTDTLVQVMPPRPEWGPDLWLVTHVDLHRSPKVQAVTTALKARFSALADESA